MYIYQEISLRDFNWNVPLTLPTPGRVEKEMNKFSRTLTSQFQSVLIAQNLQTGVKEGLCQKRANLGGHE